jgi:predicted O-methyltransferase YrrM
MKKMISYFYETLNEFKKKREINILSDSLLHFFSWAKTMRKDYPKSIADFVPWMNFNVISFLNKYLSKEMTVFEWGSGSSTLFLSQRVYKVITIEHDKEWHSKVKDMLSEYKVNNLTYKLIEPEDIYESVKKLNFIDPSHYYSKDSAYEKYDFKKYVLSIEEYSDKTFDLIIIDGRARPSCLFHSLKKLKDDGYILVDNTERKRYLEYFIKSKEYSEYILTESFAHIPFNYHYCKATLIKKNKKVQK